MTISIGGCAKIKVSRYYICNFAVGSIVYFVPKAKKGVLEAHAIKDVFMRSINGNYLSPIFLYKDTFNYLFNEDELCNQQDALTYAQDFYIDNIANLQKLLQTQC